MTLRHATNKFSRSGVAAGFSMIDVLISIVVMATALLALAVLQGTVTRNTADARARSQIAQYGDSLIDQARQGGYANLANKTRTAASGTNYDATAASVQSAAGVSGLQAVTTVSTYTYSNPTSQGGTGCTGTFVSGDGGACANGQSAAYKNVSVTLTWTDATGTSRSLTENTVVSSLALDSGSGLQNNSNFTGSVTKPVVRQVSPVVPGVIPIAIGANTDTAATNPRPELSTTTNATSYNVLTYKDLTTQVQIQQRVETTVIGCSCKYGAQLSSGVFAPSWRPTYWDGTHYVEPIPANTSPAGVDPNASSTQSPLCTYCCRDHHDYANDALDLSKSTNPASYTTDTVLYDPFRIAQGDSAHTHKRWDTSGATPKFTDVTAGDSHPYLESCRMIRVDGLWRVATDLNAEQVGFVATEDQQTAGVPTTPTSNQNATSWIPSVDAETRYQSFVKGYFNQKVAQGGTPVAAAVYNSYGLDDPSTLYYIGVSEYLHVRGLYLDNLEAPAQKQIQSAISHCTLASTIDCVLPYLPFTSINLTELALWGAPNGGKGVANNLQVTNGSGTITGDFTTNPPIRGTVSKSTGGGNQDDILVKMTASNSGVAGGVPGSSQQSIDDKDQILVAHYSGDPALVGNPATVPGYTDMQHFRVRTAAGDEFTVNAIGATASDLPQVADSITNNDPAIAWFTTDFSDSNDCVTSYDQNGANPNPYTCNTDLGLTTSGPPAVAGPNLQMWVKQYNYVKYVTENDPCDAAAAQVQHPYCENYSITEVDVGGAALIPQPTIDRTTNTGKTTEISKFTLPSVLKNGVYTIKFGNHVETGAAANTCTVDAAGSHFAGWQSLPCQ